jgi:hypothetical protein
MFRFVFLIHSKSAQAGILFFTGNFSRIFFFNLLSYILIISSFYSIPFWWYFLDIVGHLWHSSYLMSFAFFFILPPLYVCVVVYCRGLVREDLHKSRNCKDFFICVNKLFFLENIFFRKTNFQLTSFFLPLPWCALKSNSQPTSCSFAATLLSINSLVF